MSNFWDKVDRYKPAQGAFHCWLWCGSRNNHGYGQIRYRRKCYLAHRFAWAIERGVDPSLLEPGQHVRHACDNPACVNPKHLDIGTRGDNMLDMALKGRAGQAKVSLVVALHIRDRLLAGAGTMEIAGEVGLSPSAISRIRAGKNRKYLALGIGAKKLRKLTAEQIPAIRSRLASGDSCASVAADFGVHRRTISDIRTGKAWRTAC